MAVCVFIHAKKVLDGNIEPGILLYPGDYGCFKTDEDKEAFKNLFTGDAPPVPYGGVGSRYGPEEYAVSDVRAAVKEHMKMFYSLPKDEDAYWQADADFHNNLVFHPSVVHQKLRDHEDPSKCALRAVWECTGIKLDPKELHYIKSHGSFMQKPTAQHNISDNQQLHVFQISVSLDRAKYQWMDHQAERMTLTDWETSPYPKVLRELPITVPSIVYDSYCRTHGGPRFVRSASGVKDVYTQKVIEMTGVVF
jgi:hypothetical protein